MDRLTARVEDSLDQLKFSIRSQAAVIARDDRGEPSSSQGLRLIHAFARIRSDQLRDDLIAMIEAVAACDGCPDVLTS